MPKGRKAPKKKIEAKPKKEESEPEEKEVKTKRQAKPKKEAKSKGAKPKSKKETHEESECNSEGGSGKTSPPPEANSVLEGKPKGERKKRRHQEMQGAKPDEFAEGLEKKSSSYNPLLYEKEINKIRKAWDRESGIFGINVDTNVPINIPKNLISLNLLSERFNPGNANFAFLNSEACKFLWTECEEKFKNMEERLELNVRGPSGSGKSFALFSLMLRLRREIDHYRVIYFNYAQKVLSSDYVLNEILMAFYKDKEKLPFNPDIAPSTMKLDERAHGLAKWYNLLNGKKFWELGTNKIDDRYKEFFAYLKRYCAENDLKLVIIVDQENRLYTSPGPNTFLCEALRNLPCHVIIVSASNNNEGFKKYDSWEKIEIVEGFTYAQADKFIINKLFDSIQGGPNEEAKITPIKKKLIEEIKKLTGSQPGELYSLLYPCNTKLKEIERKVEKEPVADKVMKRVEEYINAYEDKRTAEITELHTKFRETLNEEEKQYIFAAYALVDSGVPMKGLKYLLDKALMYEKDGKLYSLCPLAHSHFKELCYSDKGGLNSLKNKIVDLSSEVKGSLKGCLFELAMRLYFVSLIDQPTTDQTPNTAFTGTHFPKDKCETFNFSHRVTAYCIMKLKKGNNGKEYYKNFFRTHSEQNTLFICEGGTFPGIDFLFQVKEENEWNLYGINTAIDILKHDCNRKRLSSEVFLLPKDKNPRIATAFKEVHPKGKAKFIWLGGKKADLEEIKVKILKRNEDCICVLREDNASFPRFIMELQLDVYQLKSYFFYFDYMHQQSQQEQSSACLFTTLLGHSLDIYIVLLLDQVVFLSGILLGNQQDCLLSEASLYFSEYSFLSSFIYYLEYSTLFSLIQ
eukprot:TRINITY_DN88117_c0_g1_i1.p1 TRINITY_DN88117_c0_g1~~TRINITY_DN88117_c0_g1_i1.p1  ORF type:complete len:856 (+),score=88.08 TRINITY_DN88117_c0_g1_i1:190-2757(+)